MPNDLTPKEALFCTYYHLHRNGREAAAKSGYRFPERTSQRLLHKKAILHRLESLDAEKESKRADVIAGYRRLAFGCVADAVRLLNAAPEESIDPDTLDLFLISEIKKPKGGGLEIKFFDRLKAMEHLEALVLGEKDAAASQLYAAIEQGAAALGAGDGDG